MENEVLGTSGTNRSNKSKNKDTGEKLCNMLQMQFATMISKQADHGLASLRSQLQDATESASLA